MQQDPLYRGLGPFIAVSAIVKKMKSLDIFIDGASKGNPGPAGIGAIFYNEGKVVKEISRYIGETTNNVAEYTALIHALEEALILKARCLNINTDSQLLYRQLKKEYKVRHTNIIPLFERSARLLSAFDNVCLKHIPRQENCEADRLADRGARKNKVLC